VPAGSVVGRPSTTPGERTLTPVSTMTPTPKFRLCSPGRTSRERVETDHPTQTYRIEQLCARRAGCIEWTRVETYKRPHPKRHVLKGPVISGAHVSTSTLIELVRYINKGSPPIGPVAELPKIVRLKHTARRRRVLSCYVDHPRCRVDRNAANSAKTRRIGSSEAKFQSSKRIHVRTIGILRRIACYSFQASLGSSILLCLFCSHRHLRTCDEAQSRAHLPESIHSPSPRFV
jgi:hypothetical protein